MVHVYNEWDPLEEIIVGSPLHAQIPSKDLSFAAVQNSAKDLLFCNPGAFSEKIVDETEEDIQKEERELSHKVDCFIQSHSHPSDPRDITHSLCRTTPSPPIVGKDDEISPCFLASCAHVEMHLSR